MVLPATVLSEGTACQCSRACRGLASRCLLVTLCSSMPSRRTPGLQRHPCSPGTCILGCTETPCHEEPDSLESTSPGDEDHTRPGTSPTLRPEQTSSETRPEPDSSSSSRGRCDRLPSLPLIHREHTFLPVTESTQPYGPSSSSIGTRASPLPCIPRFDVTRVCLNLVAEGGFEPPTSRI